MKKTFIGLDLLRFLLALYLMTFHTIYTYPQTRALSFATLLGMGGVATSTFFILSGFILAHVYFGRGETQVRGGARNFLIKRLTNLYPIHLIALLLFIIVILCGGGAGSLSHYEIATIATLPEANAAPGVAALWLNRLLALLMLDTWNPLYVTLNPPAWSLSVLFFFYLCFPIIAPPLLKARRPVTTLIVIALVYLIPPVVASALNLYGPPAAGLVTSNPILRLPEFMAGIVLYALYQRGMLSRLTTVPGWKVFALLFFAACFSVEAWLLDHGASYWQYVVHNGAMLPAELALILVFANSMENPAPRVRQWTARLGNAALSIFAIHLSLFFFFYKIAKFAGMGVSPLSCIRDHTACVSAYKAAGSNLGFFPLYMLFTVIAAVLFQERLVVPLRDALRRRFVSIPVDRSPEGLGTVADIADALNPLSPPAHPVP